MREEEIAAAQAAHKQHFVHRALGDGERVDGRRLLDARRVQLVFGVGAWGQVRAHWGGTKVLCHISAKLASPWVDRPTEGFVRFAVAASPNAALGQVAATEISRLLDRSFREARVVDTESLCILGGRAVWDVTVAVTLLDVDGNAVDAAHLAVAAALAHYRRPETSVVDGKVSVHALQESNPVPLVLHHVPLSFTFAFYANGKVVLDPTGDEEAVMLGRLTVVVNAQRELCGMHKVGQLELKQDQLSRCVRIAVDRVAGVVKQMHADLAADEKLRRGSGARLPDLDVDTVPAGERDAPEDMDGVELEEASGSESESDDDEDASLSQSAPAAEDVEMEESSAPTGDESESTSAALAPEPETKAAKGKKGAAGWDEAKEKKAAPKAKKGKVDLSQALKAKPKKKKAAK